MTKTAIQLMLALLLAAAALPLAHGHGEAPPAAPERHIVISPPVVGAKDFARALAEERHHLLAAPQIDLFNQIARQYGFEAEILKGGVPNREKKDADFNRAVAERLLTELVEGLPDLVTIDLATSVSAQTPDRTLTVPPLAGAVVLKVHVGPGEPNFRVQQMNFTTSGDANLFRAMVATSGTTYLLLELEQVPTGASRQMFGIYCDESDQLRHATSITVKTGPFGQAALTVLDEHGKPTPALVRLTEKSSGKLWEPPNAVDFGPQITRVTGLTIYGPGKAYTLHMLNPLRGPYWVVPGPFEMPLPEGEWEIQIVHGYEHKPVVDSFRVEAGKWTRKEWKLERPVNMPELGWYSGDDHVHSRMLDSEDAARLMAWVRAANLNVANILEMGNEDRTWYMQRGFGPDFRVQEGLHVLVPGQEDPRTVFGHAIGLNLTSLARDLDKYMLNDWVADEVHRQGGLYGHTHVGEGGLGVHRDMTLLMPRGKSDFGSIMQNVLGTERYYDFLDLGFKLAASAGSDTPYGGSVGTTRVFSFVGRDKPFSADAWFDGVQKGHTFVTNGPMLDFRVDDAMPGDEITVEGTRRLKVRGKAWGIPSFTQPTTLTLVFNGKPVKVETLADPQGSEIGLDAEIDPGSGGWLALRADSILGSQAHTTPVYVKRPGLRHWNPERAAGLIQTRLDTLKEIESLVADAEQRTKANQVSHLDSSTPMLVRQAPQIRERIELVRRIYSELQKTLEKQLAGN